MPNTKELKAVLGAYFPGVLADEDERRLHESALENQDLFNALAVEARLRDAFDDPRFRQAVIRRLRELNADVPRQTGAGFLAWLWHPARASIAISFAVLSLVVGVRHVVRLGDEPGGTAPGPSASSPVFGSKGSGVTAPGPSASSPVLGSKALQGLESPSVGSGASTGINAMRRIWDDSQSASGNGVLLTLNRPGPKPQHVLGDPMRIELALSREGTALLLDRAPNGTIRCLYPDRLDSAVTVQAGAMVAVPSAGQDRLTATGPTGTHALRVLVFAPDVAPLEVGALPTVAVEQMYEFSMSESGGKQGLPAPTLASRRCGDGAPSDLQHNPAGGAHRTSRWTAGAWDLGRHTCR